MKGKVSFYYDLPFIGRLRSRIDNPDKDLTKNLRDALNDACVAVLNESGLYIKARMIDHLNSMELDFKDNAKKAQAMSIVENFFSSFFASSSAALKSLVGAEAEDAEAEDAEDDADGAQEKDDEDFN